MDVDTYATVCHLAAIMSKTPNPFSLTRVAYDMSRREKKHSDQLLEYLGIDVTPWRAILRKMNGSLNQCPLTRAGSKRNFLSGLMLLLVAICYACSVRVAPTVHSADIFKIPDFTSQPVNIINSQPAASNIKIGSTGTGMGQIPGSVFGSLHEWTETAREILRLELEKRTVAAASGRAPKVLRLSVTNIAVAPVVFLGGNRCKVTLTVETGDGSSRDFEVEHVDVRRGRINEIAGGALAKAIAAMLSDDMIRSYLRD